MLISVRIQVLLTKEFGQSLTFRLKNPCLNEIRRLPLIVQNILTLVVSDRPTSQ